MKPWSLNMYLRFIKLDFGWFVISFLPWIIAIKNKCRVVSAETSCSVFVIHVCDKCVTVTSRCPPPPQAPTRNKHPEECSVINFIPTADCLCSPRSRSSFCPAPLWRQTSAHPAATMSLPFLFSNTYHYDYLLIRNDIFPTNKCLCLAITIHMLLCLTKQKWVNAGSLSPRSLGLWRQQGVHKLSFLSFSLSHCGQRQQKLFTKVPSIVLR